jgi:putative transposase
VPSLSCGNANGVDSLACRVVGQHRSIHRQRGNVGQIDEASRRQHLREIAAEHTWPGSRMAYRVQNREAVLRRPRPEETQAVPDCRRLSAALPCRAYSPGVGMDFQLDATADGRRLKFLNVIVEHSRLCPAIRVGRR